MYCMIRRRAWAYNSLEYWDCEPAASQLVVCDHSSQLIVVEDQVVGWIDRAQIGIIRVRSAKGVAIDIASK